MTQSRYSRFWARWDRLYSAFEDELDRGVRVSLRNINQGLPPKERLDGWVILPEGKEVGDYCIVVNERTSYDIWMETLTTQNPPTLKPIPRNAQPATRNSRRSAWQMA